MIKSGTDIISKGKDILKDGDGLIKLSDTAKSYYGITNKEIGSLETKISELTRNLDNISKTSTLAATSDQDNRSMDQVFADHAAVKAAKAAQSMN